MTTRPPLAEQLDLVPHPEGGWYRETWRSPVSLRPEGYGGQRSVATAVYFLLPPGERSRWHVVLSDELWLWHGSGPKVGLTTVLGTPIHDALATPLQSMRATAMHLPAAEQDWTVQHDHRSGHHRRQHRPHVVRPPEMDNHPDRSQDQPGDQDGAGHVGRVAALRPDGLHRRHERRRGTQVRRHLPAHDKQEEDGRDAGHQHREVRAGRSPWGWVTISIVCPSGSSK